MGVSIGYRPHDPKNTRWVSATSNFHKALENAFGSFPFTLGSADIGVLTGMKHCGFEGSEELELAIGEFGKIEVEAEW